MNSKETCPACDGEAQLVREPREVSVGRRVVTVSDEFMRCTVCDEAYYLPGQMDATQRRAAEVVRTAADLLAPERIRAIRKLTGLDQRRFERLLGVGKKTVVRWERGTVTPNVATDQLLRAIEAVPGVATFLAARHGVALPQALITPAAAALVAAADTPAEVRDVPDEVDINVTPQASDDVIDIGPHLARPSKVLPEPADNRHPRRRPRRRKGA